MKLLKKIGIGLFHVSLAPIGAGIAIYLTLMFLPADYLWVGIVPAAIAYALLDDFAGRCVNKWKGA